MVRTHVYRDQVGEGGLSAWRLARRSMWHRRGLTLLIVLTSVLVSATVVFLSGYQRQVQQAVVDATFASNGPGNAWTLVGPAGADLSAVLPGNTDRMFDRPIPGGQAQVSWLPSTFPKGIEGTLSWREDSCAHVIMESGRCPATPNEVAVSSADAARYGVSTGQRAARQSNISEPVAITVTGIYRPRDPGEGYWFGNPPIGSSGFDAHDQAKSNPLLTVRDLGNVPGAQETLDLRLDRSLMSVGELPELRSATTTLAADALRDKIRLTTAIPTSLDRIAAERARAAVGLGLTLAQLAALIAVVLVLLAAVTLTAERGELGLARLRGEPARSLRRQIVGRWAIAVTIGWLLGWIPGVAVLAVVSGRLPGHHGLPVVPAVVLAPLVTLAVMIGGITPAAQSAVGRPVIDLLRSAPTASRRDGGRQLILDVAVLVAALSGLLVAVQSGAASVLGLLVPSLLAIAIGVLLARATSWIAGVVRQRGARRGAPAGGLLTAILLVRLRGVRLLIVTICLACAFVVLAVEVEAIGTRVRRHEAEVRTGAAAVLRVEGDPSTLVEQLDRIDPGRFHGEPTMTAVVVTRRADASATRGMFVEPAAFSRIAFGADRAADQEGWLGLRAPDIRPVQLSGDAVTVTIGAHPELGAASDGVRLERNDGSARLGVDYLTADGTRHSLSLGTVSLAADDGERLRRPIGCDGGCRLLQITVAPEGAMRGALPLVGLRTERAGAASAVALGTADEWQAVPTASPDTGVTVHEGSPGLQLVVSSGGGQVAIQHAWAPAVLPVLTAADVRPEVDPVVAAPDGSPLPIRPVRRAADAIPRQLAGVAVGDLASVLRRGSGPTTSETSVEVWVSSAAAGRLPAIVDALQRQDLAVIDIETVQPAIEAQQMTAAALTGAVAPPLAGLGLVLATVCIALTAAGQRSVLTRDLAALRLTGLHDAVVRRAMDRVYLAPNLAAAFAGTIFGALGCVLVIPALPLVPDASAAIRLDRGLDSVALAGCLLAWLVAVTIVGLLCAQRIARTSRPDQSKVSR